METIERLSLYKWVKLQVGSRRPRSREASDGSTPGGNIPVAVTEDLEFVINEEIKGHEPAVILVPKGSELVIFRHPAHTAPDDTVATIFTSTYQASLRGNRRTVVRRY